MKPGEKGLLLLIRFIVFTILVLVSLLNKAQTVYSTPPMYDTALLEREPFIDTSFHPSLEIKNAGLTPLVIRFFPGWPGHEHILDHDSTWFQWINEDTITNLASFLKTPLAGTNRHSIKIIDDSSEYKKFRINEFFLGFSGRMCSDFARTAFYTLNIDSLPVRMTGTDSHAFINIRDRTTTFWHSWDFDWNTPILKYGWPFRRVLMSKYALFYTSVFKDSLTEFAGVHSTATQTRQMFWKQYVSAFTGELSEVIPPVPHSISNTDSRIILPAGASIEYVAFCGGLILNSDLSETKKFEQEYIDTTSYLKWNDYPDSICEATFYSVADNYVRACFPGRSEMIKDHLRSNNLRFQNKFGQYVYNAIQDLAYQIVKISIPPHADTLYAGKDYSFWFWVEKIDLNGSALIGDRYIHGKSMMTLLGVCDSLKRYPDRFIYYVRNRNVQTMTRGWLGPSNDTTIIYGHFNLDALPFLTGVKYEVLSGEQPVITSSYRRLERVPGGTH